MNWPENKDFAFTIFDDTDNARLENVRPVYDFIHELGFRTTKSVWPSKGNDTPIFGGDTCEDPGYAEWLVELRDKGFEIAYHMNTYHSSTRAEIIEGLERFHSIFGHYPESMANHTGCADDIYWGANRLSGLNKFVYNFFTGFRNSARFFGHVEGSKYFWGDICREFIRYCRNFVFRDINTLKQCPFMPYHDPQREYVNGWFASSDGAHLEEFNDLLKEDNQDRLEAESGCCIVYTHFGCGFYEDGKLHPGFTRLMERLSRKNGWYVPVKQLLDHLKEQNGGHLITNKERKQLERRWLMDKLRHAKFGKRQKKWT
ncbi:MAG TPA: hypothetical protein ENO22_04520 [candidate division Zixibacteria bacterium]|nr:hypothetical protein [candidate division Zixibacteria bacterium]